MAPSFRILVIDDDAETSGALCRILTRRRYVVRAENDSRRALKSVQAFKPQLVILDFAMPYLHGGDVAWQLWSDPLLRSTKLIICSASPYEEVRASMPPTQIPFLAKPVDWEVLLQKIQSGVECRPRN